MEQLLISISDAAKALNLGRTSIYELIKNGKIETVKFGSRRLVKAASVRALVEQGG